MLQLSYFYNRSVSRFCFRECNESSSFFDLHRHIYDGAKVTEMLLQIILSNRLARHVDRVSSFGLLLGRHVGFFRIAILFLLELLIQK